MESHSHSHSHQHVHTPSSMSREFVFCIALNALFVLIEAGVGLVSNSLGLLSDAGHNLSDVFSLLLVLIGFRLAAIPVNSRYTYGYRKSTVLISLLNAIILLIAVGAIILESIHKFSNPEPLNGSLISWTAGVGILVNGVTTLLLMKGGKHDLNVRGAFLHMAADTLVSVGVVVAGLLITWTGISIIDPIISLFIAAVILFSTWKLMKDSLELSLDGMPIDLSLDEVENAMKKADHVKDVHHVHIWAISTTENALTAHVVIDELGEMEGVKQNLKSLLRDKGIAHATLEMETSDCQCHEHDCCCCSSHAGNHNEEKCRCHEHGCDKSGTAENGHEK